MAGFKLGPYRCVVFGNVRYFAAPKKGGKGKAGGGPPVAEYIPPEYPTSALEEMVKDKGEDAFIFGPPHGVSKISGVHRNYIQPKVG